MFENAYGKLDKFLAKIFGSRNQRILKTIEPIVVRINTFEDAMKALSAEQLRAKSAEFRKRLADGQTLDDLLPEAFAAVREASRRVTNMRHFDVQMIGGIVLHQGKIAEMATGEGKTLVATSPVYLNALEGKGVHVVTVNDYLARRDTQWMGPIYDTLGLSIGCIQHDIAYIYDSQYNPDPEDKLHNLRLCEYRREAYHADITYGTNNEFGFDYLRDNMKVRMEDLAQRDLHYAIVDEVDSILIDEARTPLIISGPAEESTEKYYMADNVARQLKKGEDYEVKEKENQVILTEEGIDHAQQLVGVDSFYSGANMDWPHHIEQALRANALYQRDKEYVVKEGEVIIVDEFTGRMMPGRRWSDGLHQAVEAREHLKIREENQTLATITLQNLFKLYKKISGMTGTAATEAAEFENIYKLEVVTIPTNKILIRTNHPDVVFRTKVEKFNAVTEEIIHLSETGRPMLVGTTSIENSELISGMLKRRGVKHEVLNAKHHEREADIIKNAGQHGVVTIATNMAGRGTDIILGEGVAQLGGLHILGTERHEARRIDNQLRGRAGRQGDPGSSQFILALEDDLLRIFAPEWVQGLLGKLGMAEGQPIESRMVSRAIEKAQKKMEGHNFDIRKHLIEYDEVMNEQRKAVYGLRRQILEGRDLKQTVKEMIEESTGTGIDTYMPPRVAQSEWNHQGLCDWCRTKFAMDVKAPDIQGKSAEEVEDLLIGKLHAMYDEREKALGAETMRRIERFVLLSSIDEKWKDHLYAMDHLRASVSLRSFAQSDPKIEYKREGSQMFQMMMDSIKEDVGGMVLRVRIEKETEDTLGRQWKPTTYSKQELGQFETAKKNDDDAKADSKPRPYVGGKKVGRNDPCPCGAKRPDGQPKKYKQCCGRGG